ncbi:MAG: hypothetical protein QOF92_3363, partial [Pseudonocardiales bacterium]|nr:hypothetical protein [Pseudonocardiales bacterium]
EHEGGPDALCEPELEQAVRAKKTAAETATDRGATDMSDTLPRERHSGRNRPDTEAAAGLTHEIRPRGAASRCKVWTC